MRFENMTDDELKRFLLLGTQDKCAALAMQEAVNRWLADMDTVDKLEEEYQRGYTHGQEDATANDMPNILGED